jgi:hypothetical protein
MNETQLRDELERLSADLPTVDLADSAWARAHDARRRRPRWALVAGGAAAAAAVAVALGGLPRPLADRQPAPAGSPASSGTPAPRADLGLLPTRSALGVVVQEAPRARDLTRLYRDPAAGGLPEVLDVGPRTVLPTLDRVGPIDRPVTAVLLRQVTPAATHPVLVLAGNDPLYVEVGVALTPVGEPVNGPMSPLPPGAISPDRTKVALVQRDRVVIVDLRAGEVRSVPVPAPGHGLEHGGWTTDGRSFLATGTGESPATWRVDPVAGTATAVPRGTRTHPGRFALARPESAFQRIEYTPSGEEVGRVDLAGPVDGISLGATVTSAEGAAAQQVWWLAEEQHELGGYQGVYLAGAGPTPDGTVLAFPGGPAEDYWKGCCSALGWTTTGNVLLRADGPQPRTPVISWSAKEHRLLRFVRINDATNADGIVTVGGLTSAIAL